MNHPTLRLSPADPARQMNILSALSVGLFAGGVIGAATANWQAALIWGVLACLCCLPVRGMGVILCGLSAIFALIFHSNVLGGLMSLANGFRPWLIDFTGRIVLPYAGESHPLWFLLPLGGLLAPLFARKPMRLLCWCMVAAGCVLGLLDAGWYLLLMAAGTMGCMAAENGGRLGSILLLLACLGLSVGLGFAGGAIDLSPQAARSLHTAFYDSETNSMPEGQLADLRPWEKNTTPALSVTMETPQKLYLRGFVGTTYTGLSWEPAETDVETSDLFYWLHDGGYYSAASIAAAAEKTGAVEPKTMTIRNLSACSAHAYTPYALCGTAGLDVAGIGREVDAAEELTCQYLPGSVPMWYEIQAVLAEQQLDNADYLALEQAYRQYALDHALQLTPDASEAAKALLGEMPPKTLAEIRFAILEALGNHFRYDEDAHTWNGDADFFRYVQSVSPKGYSVHYATAATLLLRYCGVPARYVEGYYLPPADAAETVILTEENAHAWAEYYLDGVGWIPFETTPGYIDPEEILPEATDGRKEYDNDPPTPPIVRPDEPQQREDHQSGLPWWFWPILPALAVAIAAVILLRRRKKLCRRLDAMAQAEPREAVALLYGYACYLQAEPDAEAAYRNQLAQFSPEPVTQDDRDWMLAYVQTVVSQVKAARPLPKRLYDRYIRCIYR